MGIMKQKYIDVQNIVNYADAEAKKIEINIENMIKLAADGDDALRDLIAETVYYELTQIAQQELATEIAELTDQENYELGIPI